jgi:hypothetical protein
MPLIWCSKHKRVVNASTQIDYKDDFKITGYTTKCGCSFKTIDGIRVERRLRYFLPDGRELIKLKEKISWRIK